MNRTLLHRKKNLLDFEMSSDKINFENPDMIRNLKNNYTLEYNEEEDRILIKSNLLSIDNDLDELVDDFKS